MERAKGEAWCWEWLSLVDASHSVDSSCELHVLSHDGDALGMYGAQVCVFKQSHERCFHGFLQREERRCLEAVLHAGRCVLLRDLAHEPTER